MAKLNEFTSLEFLQPNTIVIAYRYLYWCLIFAFSWISFAVQIGIMRVS